MRDGKGKLKIGEKVMSSIDLDKKIHSFLDRKHAEFPELTAASGRQDSRTVKYAMELRGSGQLAYGR